MSPDNGMLFNGVLRPKLHNNPFAACSFINLDFVLLHTAHFNDDIVLSFLVFNTFESTFSVFCVHFKQYVNIFYNGQCVNNLELMLFRPFFNYIFVLKILICKTYKQRILISLLLLYFSLLLLFNQLFPVFFLQLKQ